MNKFEMAKALKQEMASFPGAQEFVFHTYEEIIDIIFNKLMLDELKSGNEVYIPKFGKFQSIKKPERTARNPSTNTAIQLPEKMVVKFKPSLNLKESINS